MWDVYQERGYDIFSVETIPQMSIEEFFKFSNEQRIQNHKIGEKYMDKYHYNCNSPIILWRQYACKNNRNNQTDKLCLWITVRWRPDFKCSWERAKKLLAYGWKLLASGLLDTGYRQLRTLIIGKK